MFPLLDAGGPFVLVFFGGVIVAGVLCAVGVVMGGMWLIRRTRGNVPPDDTEMQP